MTIHDPTQPETRPSTRPSPLMLVSGTPTSSSPRAKRRRSKAKAKHRGVRLIKPSPDHGHRAWRLGWTDPDSRKARFRNLTDAESLTADTRRDAAVAQLETLKHRRHELKLGANPHKHGDVLLVDAIEQFHTTFGAQMRERTQQNYRRLTGYFVEWCARAENRYRYTRQLTRGALRMYAGSRVAVKVDGAIRKPTTINNELKTLGAVLRELRSMELVGLSSDDISLGLKPLTEDVTPGAFCTTPELFEILGGCAGFDVDPHRGPYARRALPATLFMLLTGLRPKEAVGIGWSDVTVVNGHPRIKVRAEVSKTRRERTIDTAHSPLLAYLVSDHAGRTGLILGGNTDSLFNLRRTLSVDYSTTFDFKTLRRTCGTYLTCAPSIFGAASVYLTAKQLGHTVEVAQKYYLGVVTVPVEATTTEAAMGLVTEYTAAGSASVSVTVVGPEVRMVSCPKL